MDTIRSYLESMFKNLPLTEKVMRAKSELLQMMEDKYTELIKEGKTENEAVGIVISEFGNLEELVEDLGIKDIYTEQRNETKKKRLLTFDEIKKFIDQRKRSALLLGIGIACLICCVVCPILGDAASLPEILFIPSMFVMIGIGVMLIIMSSSVTEEVKFIFLEPCSLDSVETDYLRSERTKYISTYSIMKSVGILCFILCCIPPIIFDNIGTTEFVEALGPAFLFIFVGLGVFLTVYSSKIKKSYDILLSLNGGVNLYETTNFYYEKKEVVYKNKVIETIMSVFWITITCVYLSISFLTGAWEITWIIWPIAAIFYTIIKNLGKEE